MKPRSFFSGLWRALDGLRKVLHLIVLLVVFGIIIGIIRGSVPLVPSKAALVIAPEGPLVEQLAGNPRQRLRVSDRLALAVVGAHQALLDLVRATVGGGEMDQAVGVERAAAARDLVVEVDAVLGADRGQSLLRLERPLTRAAVLGPQVGRDIDVTFAWGVGIELEAPPCDLDLVAVLEAREGRLEAPLSHEAPGAGDV